MAEIIAEIGPAQFDLFEDQRAQIRRLVAVSVGRLGLSRIAHLVRKDPSTISHQLSGLDPSKNPSAELFGVCFLLDAQFRADLLSLCGEVLSRPPDLDPEDAMREVVTLAMANEMGNAAKERVVALYARMKKGGAAK